MASLWKLPLILCIENNKYGMGTSTDRSSSNNTYYTMGNMIPGMKVYMMSVHNKSVVDQRRRHSNVPNRSPLVV